MKNATHMMIDFETLDTRPSSVVISLGAVVFTANQILRERYWVFDQQEQISKGRTISADTIAWWMKQSDAARAVFQTPKAQRTSLKDFHVQMRDLVGQDRVQVWGNGADFDTPIILDLYARHPSSFTQPAPWKYYEHRCYRTIAAITGCKDFSVRTGVHHNALDDAKHQARCLMVAFQKGLLP